MDQTGTSQPRVSQTIVNGTLGTPAVFSVLLLLCAMLMGWSVSKMYDIEQTMNKNNTELRILQVHVQDMNAILIREGLVKNGDLMNGPTSGESVPPKEKKK